MAGSHATRMATSNPSSTRSTRRFDSVRSRCTNFQQRFAFSGRQGSKDLPGLWPDSRVPPAERVGWHHSLAGEQLQAAFLPSAAQRRLSRSGPMPVKSGSLSRRLAKTG